MLRVLLPADRIKDKGLQLIEENPELHMNTRTEVYDSDTFIIVMN